MDNTLVMLFTILGMLLFFKVLLMLILLPVFMLYGYLKHFTFKETCKLFDKFIFGFDI